MADEADISQARMEKEYELAEAARLVAAKNRPISEDCVECGERIGFARQRATGGTEYCRDCAEIVERKPGVYR